jgi:hypothetical protein
LEVEAPLDSHVVIAIVAEDHAQAICGTGRRAPASFARSVLDGVDSAA